MKAVFLAAAVALVLAAVVLSAQPGLAVRCQDVNTALGPCVSYLQNGGNPSGSCCNGVKSLNGMTPATGDRRAACQCIKQAAARYQNLRPDAASSLPGKCGVHLNVPISRDVDCNSIS